MPPGFSERWLVIDDSSLNLVEFTALAADWKLDEATAAKVFKKYDKDKDNEL
jgi:ABC-type uncharacterized transport system substrate-binding protein